jgi:hypothetical protein
LPNREVSANLSYSIFFVILPGMVPSRFST